MKTYKIIDPKGFFYNEKRESGSTFTAPGPRDAAVAAGLHFKQIEEVTSEKTDKPELIIPKASEAARKLAEEKGIDLGTVTGTGENGAITKPDVEAAIASAK